MRSLFWTPLALFAACSSDDGSSAISAECREFCDAAGQAGCPVQDSVAECAADCQREQQDYKACAEQSSSFHSCVTTQAVFQCSPSGKLTYSGCDAEIASLAQCAACLTDSTDDACDVCAKQKCCKESLTIYSAAEFPAWLKCAAGCSDQACSMACVQAFPSIESAISAWGACRGSSCGC